MSSSTHQIKIKANDQTAGAFSSIQKRAAAAGSGIKNMLGGAIAAAGAYLGANAFMSGVKELGALSDRAAAASTSVDELTKASTAMSVLGIKGASVEQLADAFARMEKTTGRTGMQGFYQTIEELGKIDDASQRASLAMEVFGRSGMNFIPLINAADTGVEALQGVVDAMPGIPQAAADAGDEAADAIEILGNGAKSLWLSAIGELVEWFSGQFPGGIREAAAKASNALIYYAKVSFLAVKRTWTQITNFSERLGGAIGTFFGSIANGASIKEAWQNTKDDWKSTLVGQQVLMEEQDKKDKERIQQWTNTYTEQQHKIERMTRNIKKATESTRSRQKRDFAGLAGNSSSASSMSSNNANISNSLIMGGTNAATRLAILGPQTTEIKKIQTTLQKIEDATKKTADNTKQNNTKTIDVKPI